MRKFISVFIFMISICFAVPAWSENLPEWRILWAALPELNVFYDGEHYVYSLSDDEIAKIQEMGERSEHFIENATGNAVDSVMKYFISKQAVTSLTDFFYLYVDEENFPDDVKAEIQRAKDIGAPYHIVAVTYRLHGESEKINSYYGLGGGRCARVRYADNASYELSETNLYPEEVWVHELQHCFEGFFGDVLGYPMANADGAETHGYENINGSWAHYYQDSLSGRVWDSETQSYIGIKSDMWQYAPGEVQKWKGHTYQLFNKAANWDEAEEFCKSLGGHLVTINNADEQKMIEIMLKSSEKKFWLQWLGGIKKDSVWQWVTGEEFNYNNFAERQPDNSGDYLQIYSWGEDYEGFWDDTDNGNQDHGFICEWDYLRQDLDLAPSITTSSLPETVTGQKYSVRLHSTGKEFISWSAEGLPSGLECSISGDITGTASQAGKYVVNITASNSEGQDRKIIILNVAKAPEPEPEQPEQEQESEQNQQQEQQEQNQIQEPEQQEQPEQESEQNQEQEQQQTETKIQTPEIITTSLKDATVGQEYFYTIRISGTWPMKCTTSGLPEGLSCNDRGEITGIPYSAGDYQVKITAENDAGSDSVTLSMYVKDPDNNPNHNTNNSGSGGSSGGGGCSTNHAGIYVIGLIFMLIYSRRVKN